MKARLSLSRLVDPATLGQPPVGDVAADVKLSEAGQPLELGQTPLRDPRMLEYELV